MAKLKSERHHWWPECVSEHWSDPDGGVHWLLPSGEIRRLASKSLGVINNGHSIKLGVDPAADSHWDQNFEPEFQSADSNFPAVISLLNQLDHCGPPFDRPIASRIITQDIQDEEFSNIVECLVSLAARSPAHREKAASVPEYYRGSLSERERNQLIGLNIRNTQRNAVRNLRSGGKMMVIFSPEREFIFGDGFFNNLTTQGEHWYNPKLFVPLTLWLSVLFVRPMRYMTDPRLVTLVVSSEETKSLNYAVQVYSRNAIYYRSEKPDVDVSFTEAKHLIFSDHRNSIDQLIHMIPGIPPRDASLDFLNEFRRGNRPAE